MVTHFKTERSTQDRIYPEDVTLICPDEEQIKRVIERSNLRIRNAEFVRAAKKGSSRYLAGFLKDAVDKAPEDCHRLASHPTPQTHSHERWPLDGEMKEMEARRDSLNSQQNALNAQQNDLNAQQKALDMQQQALNVKQEALVVKWKEMEVNAWRDALEARTPECTEGEG
ncbi:hypothetical protein N7465_007917 [Penicillium sp. CMV-2018d]|nr:hypothetical protein N7465_007917 [Penicillium sp. CMV-2018d]